VPTTAKPDISIIIPTRDRPALLARAIASALAQDDAGTLEVIVVDDASTPPATVPPAPRVRLVRPAVDRGGAAARNSGLAAARGRWVTWLDDDDELVSGGLAACLAALAESDLPPPVAAVAALEVVDADGEVTARRRPPTLPRGGYWNLETVPAGRSFQVKQSLVIERAVVAGIGGFDERFRAHVHSDLFLRLNPVCSILGVDRPGYRFHRHGGATVTGDPVLRAQSLAALIDKHRAVLERRARPFAGMLIEHASICALDGRRTEALRWHLRAARYDPVRVGRTVLGGWLRGQRPV